MKRALVVLAAAGMLLAGCSHPAEPSIGSAAVGAAAASTGAPESSGSPGSGFSGPGVARSGVAGVDAGTGTGTGTTAAVTRARVRTAAIAVQTPDPDAAADLATDIADAAGGRVDQDVRTTSAHLVLRVPAPALDGTLGKLRSLGIEKSRTVTGDDVTGEQADVGARTAALQTSVTRLSDLLSRSGNLSDLLQLEQQLTQRQSDLESMQAQQRALADQVALAQITLDLSRPAATAHPAKSGPTGFGGAVSGGWRGALLVLRYLVATLGYSWPVLLIAAAAFGGLRWQRKRKRRRPPPAGPLTPPPGPPQQAAGPAQQPAPQPG